MADAAQQHKAVIVHAGQGSAVHGGRGLKDDLYDQRNAVIFSENAKSPGLLTYQDQQTGASNFVNIDFAELRHIFFLHGIPWHI